MSEQTSIQITKPTGAVVRHSTQNAGHADVVGTADLGAVLRSAKRVGEYWRAAGGRYVPASAAIPISNVLNVAAPTQPVPGIQALSQRDKRWAGVPLGNTTDGGITIGGYGCLLCGVESCCARWVRCAAQAWRLPSSCSSTAGNRSHRS